jgi:4-amino-4-deoxy-L-arabinose transferase-like glycosyltransferase
MVTYFPKQISSRAIVTYLLSLVVISLFYYDYAMRFGFMVLGVTSVICFFSLTSVWSKGNRVIHEKVFIRNLFVIAFLLRILWVIGSYYYFISATGIPFEYDAADAVGYHEEAKWLNEEGWGKVWEYYFGSRSSGISDVGYPLYLTALYSIFGPVIIIPRIIKAFISAYTCILVYRISERSFGEETGRMAGIMMALMPNLIIYCGYHLKETEMLFLEVAFMERLDYLLRSKKASFWAIFLPTIIAGSLFFFRTILGLAAIFTFATAVLLSNTPTMKKGWKRTALIGWGVFALAIISGGTAMTEIEAIWEEKEDNASLKRLEQTQRGNQWAQYATGAVMAPMAFVLPYATMVDVNQQYNQQTKHGGNYVRNFMGFFAILAIYEAFRRKQWRGFVLIGAFVISYLGVVSLSGFSNSERFLLPGLPCLVMMWAYGVSALREKTYRLLTPWCVLVFLMEFGWAFFKLGNRGLL